MALDIYKPGQGKYTRLWSAGGISVVAALGCYLLFQKLEATDQNIWVKALVPAVLCAVLVGAFFWMVNIPRVADFMIAAEGEIKKVSWSSRQEIIVSTFIVISVVVLISALLGVTDVGFAMFFDWLLKL